MEKFTKLSRTELKNIVGAGAGDKLAPYVPIFSEGGGGGGDDGGRRYKCCWDSNVDSCSGCVTIYSNPVCSRGSSPTAC